MDQFRNEVVRTEVRSGFINRHAPDSSPSVIVVARPLCATHEDQSTSAVRTAFAQRHEFNSAVRIA